MPGSRARNSRPPGAAACPFPALPAHHPAAILERKDQACRHVRHLRPAVGPDDGRPRKRQRRSENKLTTERRSIHSIGVAMAMPETKPGITAAFVDRLQAVRYAALPKEAIEVARQVVVDTLGVALAGVTRAPEL